ncbi:inositol-3-phosphate synthase [Marinactinospora endophytica]
MSAPLPPHPPSPGPHSRDNGDGLPARERIGAWFIGARGSVATTAAVGISALGAGLADVTGCVTELPGVAGPDLPLPGDIVIGGHDITAVPLVKRAEELSTAGVLPAHLPRVLAGPLADVETRLRPGIRHVGAASRREAADRVEADLRAFQAEHRLDRVVVVDLSATEPPAPVDDVFATPAAWERALDGGAAAPPTSSLYAYAALRAGCSFVAFTPSPSIRLPALTTMARQMGIPWAGSDAKTGETLVKAALAPMFATRALRVRSWSSVNLLGGGDGATLADPDNAASKIASKARGLEAILGHPVEGPLHIDHVPHLGDWKTAWDHISFEGFLGVRMNLQFTWSGCDSALAAPLVLDLVRLMSRAHRAGENGPVGALGFFFKDPAGSDEHRLAAQWDALVAWRGRHGAEGRA